MGTRSTIAVQHKDGSISQIYCHWDGYLDYNGAILAKNYNTQELVEALIALGDLSSLGENIGTQHDFNDCPKGECNYYGRDRGETNVWPKFFKDLEEFAKEFDEQEFNYIFIEGAWWVQTDHYFNSKRVLLSEALERAELEDQ